MNPELQAAIDAAVAKATAPLTAQLDAANKQINLLTNPPTLEQVQAMDEAQLAELGLTKADVEAAVAELAAEGATAAEPAPVAGAEGAVAPVAGAAAPAAVAAAAPAGVALAAIQKQLTELSTAFVNAQNETERKEVEVLFTAIEAKVTALSSENARLKTALAAGGKPSSTGVDRNQVRFFSANKNEGKFENLVQLGIEEKKLSRLKSFEAAQKEDPAAYQDYLVRLGVIKAVQA